MDCRMYVEAEVGKKVSPAINSEVETSVLEIETTKMPLRLGGR